MRIRRGPVAVALMIVMTSLSLEVRASKVQQQDVSRWEDVVTAWEAEDRAAPPPEGAVVFIGSSSIVRWDTIDADMAPLTLINRGFGGSFMQDALHYVDRIVTNYKPRAVVLYEGDNDLGRAQVSPGELLEKFKSFVDSVHAVLPETRIYFIAIKPSVSRWNNWALMNDANQLVIAEIETDDRLTYIDVATPMLGPNQGRPPEDLFVRDMLHMTPKGYAIWTDVVRSILVEREAPYEK